MNAPLVYEKTQPLCLKGHDRHSIEGVCISILELALRKYWWHQGSCQDLSFCCFEGLSLCSLFTFRESSTLIYCSRGEATQSQH